MNFFRSVANIFRIAHIAVRELIYERVFYVLLCFSILSVGLSLLLGQMTYAEQYKLTLDFMLAGMQISMILFSIFVGISLFQKELQMGSVSMVLSKPISRTTFLLGKFLGQVVVQIGVTSAMALVTIGICSAFQSVEVVPILQTALMIIYEVTIITAVTYLFAVNAGGMTTAVVTLCFFSVGHMRETVSKNLNPSSTVVWIWRGVRNIFPDLEAFNIKAMAAYGITVAPADMAWATLYAACCVVFYLILAAICFSRKDILT